MYKKIADFCKELGHKEKADEYLKKARSVFKVVSEN